MQLFILSLAVIAAVQCTAVYGSRAPDAPPALLDGYYELVPPDVPVKVAVTAHVIRSYDYNEKDSDFKVDVHLIQHWKDARLVRMSSYGLDEITGGDKLRQAIWTPDPFFAEENGGGNGEVMTSNVIVRVNASGDVFMSQRETVKVICDPDIRKFPRDVRKCNLTLEINAYSVKSIDYQWKECMGNPVQDGGSLTDFELLNGRYIKDTIALDSGDTHDRLRVTFVYQRKFGDHFGYIFLSLTATLASVCAMLHNQDETPRFRILLSTSILVCHIVLYAYLMASSPRHGELTLADEYFSGNLFFVHGQFVLVGLVTALARDVKVKAKNIVKLMDSIGNVVIYVSCVVFNIKYMSSFFM